MFSRGMRKSSSPRGNASAVMDNEWMLVDSVEDYSQTGQSYTIPGGETGLPAGISCAGSLLQDEVALIEDSEKEMAFQPFTVFQKSLCGG